MEILGNIIPGLENVVASGLDSVRSGIIESAKANGDSALGIAQDSFSFEQMGQTVSTDLPVVAAESDYVSPHQYFQSGPQFDSPVSAEDISKILNSPTFNASRSIQMFSRDLQGVIDQGAQALKRTQLDAAPSMEYGDPLRQTQADSSGLLNFIGMKQEMYEVIEKHQKQLEEGILLNRIGVDLLSPADSTSTDVKPSMSGSKAESTLEEARKHGTSTVVPDVIAGEADAGSDRGIIVVGGKTTDTYLQTIDDSWNEFQTYPTKQNADIFGTQLNAVRSMTSTVDQVVQLQQSLTVGLLTRQFGM